MTFLLEDRSTIPEDGQADQTAATASKLETALARARAMAKDLAREHGRTTAMVYVYEEGTQNVWSVQWHPEEGVSADEAATDADGRPELDDEGEPVLIRRRTYPVGFRIVHDSSERLHEYGTDDQGRQVVTSEQWVGGLEVTDLDDDGKPIPVDDSTTNALKAVTHVEVRRAR